MLALILVATPAESAIKTEPRSAFFCQGEGGPGRSHAFAAIREISDGDVQFAVSKWQENGHHFGLFRIAQRDGDRWVYKERASRSLINSEGSRFHAADMEPNAIPTCKVTIEWPRTEQLSIWVDPQMECDEHHGAAFAWLSSRFTEADYNGEVRGELDDTDRFFNDPRCDEPGARHGPVQVIR